MTLGIATRPVQGIFQDRQGREHLSEIVPFAFLVGEGDSEGNLWGMRLIGIIFRD